MLALVAAAAPTATAAGRTRTLDRDGDGRIDAVKLTLARSITAARISVDVAGYREVGLRRRNARVLVRLRERPTRDTGARPRVAARGGSRTVRVKAQDGARPAVVGARLEDGDGDRAPGELVVSFSEPVSFRGAAAGERVFEVAGLELGVVPAVRWAWKLRAEVTGAAAPAAGRLPVVPVDNAAGVRDRAGNAALVSTARTAQPARREKPNRNPTPTPTPTPGPTGAWHTLANPIDPRQLTGVPFGLRSHWHQPWRAYLETPPASQLRDAVGINFNVSASAADATAALLAESGFERARLEVGWGEMSYDQPDRLRDPSPIRARLAALKAHGIRPLILLNANDGAPGPIRRFPAKITTATPAGAREVRVDAATAAAMVPGLSGFDGVGGKAAEYIVTSVATDGRVELSKPLSIALGPGTYPASILRYQPFTRPFTSTGLPHPSFERTFAGWIAYVRAVTAEAMSVLGNDAFDVEIWNELSFGSDFLFVDRYFDPVPVAMSGVGDPLRTILVRTVGWLRNPANGVAGVGIGDGFANQTPFSAGSTSPVGLTALDKHPYHAGVNPYPETSRINEIRPVDALGRPDGVLDEFGRWHDTFVPTYRAFFPEYHLSAIQTETMVRDLAPITTTISGIAHGRATAPPGSSTPPQVWITETNIHPGGAGPLTAGDKRHLQAKAALRILAAFVNKGVTALYFYAVADGDFAMVDPAAPGGGETMAVVRRLTQAMTGAETIVHRRALSLQETADRHDHRQFDGDGTAAHPPLYNREVVAFLPFQADDHRFVVPCYVMTRDMGLVRQPAAAESDPRRYDLPPETYRLKVGGVAADRLKVGATDPLTGETVPVSVVSRDGATAVIEIGLTDSPRLLVLDDA